MDKIVDNIIKESKPKGQELPGYAKTLMKFDRNKLFKGHQGIISYGVWEDKSSYLTIMQQYFDSWIYFNYNFESNKSELSVVVNAMPTKYMEAFYNKITENGKYILTSPKTTGIYENKSELHICQFGSVSLTHTLFYDGFIGLGHSENIRIVEYARTLMKRFKSIIRENGNSRDFCNKIKMIKGENVFIAESLYTDLITHSSSY